jgi:hypothetical protein
MRTVLAEFSASLARVRDIADDNDNNVATIMSSPAVRARYETGRCAATVILSGFLESFLRQLADKCIDAVCSLRMPFSSLPAKIRHSHYEFGGEVLSRRAQDDRASRPSRIQATVDDIAARLASVTATPYDLVWEGFAETYANPNSETISQYLKKFGIDKPWEKIAAEAGSSATSLQTALDSFLALRHECAHTGTASTVPTASELRGFCDLLGTITSALVKVLEDHVGSL